MEFIGSYFQTLSPEFFKKPYSLVIFGNLLVAFQLLLFTYIYVIKARFQTFTGKFIKSSGIAELH